VCDGSTGLCVLGGACGAAEIPITPVPPNLLVVLDRSCTMQQLVAGTPKWTIAAQAIDELTSDYLGQIRFGLTLFPDHGGQDCQQGAIPIPVGPGNEAAIQSLLDASTAPADPNYPDGPCVTNIDTAMQQAAGEPAFNDPDRSSYVLLVTDGKQQSCSAAGGDTGTMQIISTLLQIRNVPTFVLGFGSAVDPAQLNAFAQAGGVPAADPQAQYYQAEDQASLEAALGAIAQQAIACVVQLQAVPEDPSQLYVFFNDDPTPIPADPAQGWQYDPATNQITFYGASCEALQSGSVSDVDVVYGCTEPPPG
jgi:hypothetical protein